MGGKEILTLQFGHFSNYVGTHWWNIQEQSFEYNSLASEVNHEILYREGLTDQVKQVIILSFEDFEKICFSDKQRLLRECFLLI